jgi:hypothetical protein
MSCQTVCSPLLPIKARMQSRQLHVHAPQQHNSLAVTRTLFALRRFSGWMRWCAHKWTTSSR